VFALLSDVFDTMGTLVGVGKQAGYDKNAELPDVRKPLLVDSLSAMAAARRRPRRRRPTSSPVRASVRAAGPAGSRS
jgi:hypothetical protein